MIYHDIKQVTMYPYMLAERLEKKNRDFKISHMFIAWSFNLPE